MDRKWDVVQIIGPTPFFTEQCVAYAKRNQLNVAYTINALPGLSSFHDNFFARSIDHLYENLYLKKRLKLADIAIFNTEDYAAYCKFYRGPYCVIPYGLNYEQSGEENLSSNGTRNHEGNSVLFVGQLRRYKGIKFLILAVKDLIDRRCETKLTIVGNGPDRKSLERLIRKLGLQQNVSILNNVDDKELSRVYQRSEVFVLPSIGAESFGIVLLEARARGLSLIASDLPGVRELTNDLGGTTVEPGDSHLLAEALFTAFKNSKSRSEESKPDLTRFLWKNLAMDYLRVYEKLFTEKSGATDRPVQPANSMPLFVQNDD